MTTQTHESRGKVLPTLREVIEGALGFQLPPLHAPPLTVKNLDKVCAALLDVPPAHVGSDAATIVEELNSVLADAMRRQFRGASTFVGMPLAAAGQPFDLGGTYYRLQVIETKETELDTDEKRTAALAAVPGVTLSATGRELRAIVAKKRVHAYVEKLARGFAERGFDLQTA